MTNFESQQNEEERVLLDLETYLGDGCVLEQNHEPIFPDAFLNYHNKNIIIELSEFFPYSDDNGSYYKQFKGLLHTIEERFRKQSKTGFVSVDVPNHKWRMNQKELYSLIDKAIKNGSFQDRDCFINYHPNEDQIQITDSSFHNFRMCGEIRIEKIRPFINRKEEKLKDFKSSCKNLPDEAWLIIQESFTDCFICDQIPFDSAFDRIYIYTDRNKFKLIYSKNGIEVNCK